jgi:hypothetical protein
VEGLDAWARAIADQPPADEQGFAGIGIDDAFSMVDIQSQALHHRPVQGTGRLPSRIRPAIFQVQNLRGGD